jgi:transposase
MLHPENESVGVLIDSTGLPNDINVPITAISSHDGDVVSQIRLIYVVEQGTFNPLYYRAIPGNVVDVVTLKGIINELQTMNVNVKYSVLDAGYNSESNLEALFSLGIDFMTRLISNRGLYKELLSQNCDIVMNHSNRIVYNQRLLYMIMNKVKLPNNRTAYAYIGVDAEKKFDNIMRISLHEDPKKPMTNEEYEIKTKMAGMFVMISSLEMPIEEVLPYYYSRQTIEQIFDTSKNYSRLLPIGTHTIETLNGHLLLSFMTTIVYLRLQRIFHKQKFNAIDLITEMRGVMCGVYEDHLHIYEPTAKQKEILKILKIEIPTEIPLIRPKEGDQSLVN